MFELTLRYGFMEDPDVPAALRQAREQQGLVLDEEDVTFFLGRETLIATQDAGHGAVARAAVRADGAETPVRATAFFRLPPERVVELGVQVEL